MAGSGQKRTGNTGPLAAGTLLQNRYLVERLIGGGGMGMVYLARDQRLSNRPSAIKEMVDHFIDPQQRLEANEYFAREADTLAQLKHPAIPAISDRFDDQNRHYLVMEYVEGRNLEEELAAHGEPLPEGTVIDIGRQLADVLAYLHNLTPPIVYRDMKPSNVMLTPKGRVVLVDFGIARLFKAARKGTMIGTLGFAPPEQYQGQVDPRSDIYSLGATLHYVLTGRDPEKFPPFSFPAVRSARPEVSSNLAAAIDSALAYKVEDRPATIQAFRDMMLYGRGIGSRGVAAVSPRSGTAGLSGALAPEFSQPLRPRRRLRGAVALLFFSLGLGAAAFGATYLYSDSALQLRLGIKPLIDALPWKHEELLARAREHPLELEHLAINLSTREGSPLSAAKTSFSDTELTSARYLSWSARFKNLLAGLDGRSDKIEGRFYDPNGLQIASSSTERFVGPGETKADFNAVALIPDVSDRPLGPYKLALYLGDQELAEQTFQVSRDLAAQARAEREKAAAAAAAKAEAEGRRAEQKRLAMIEERRAQPLRLLKVQFVNSTKDGTALSPPSDRFDSSKVFFIGWEATFENRLFKLENGEYRVDAAYVAPGGRALGSVDDVRTVPAGSRTASFTGRVGNSAGGAFLPGSYTVQFFLNSKFLTQKTFRVVADRGLPNIGYSSGAAAGRIAPGLDSPALASGTISGLAGKSDVPMEIRLRPQPNGFLHGELVIHEAGYGATGIEGFIRGDRVQFQVPYGAETIYFEGRKSADTLSGSFQATPSGTKGSWSARTN